MKEIALAWLRSRHRQNLNGDNTMGYAWGYMQSHSSLERWVPVLNEEKSPDLRTFPASESVSRLISIHC